MSDSAPLYTDLTITPIGSVNLKRYFNSIKRTLPEGWKNVFNEVYKDNDTLIMINDFCCLQTPFFLMKLKIRMLKIKLIQLK